MILWVMTTINEIARLLIKAKSHSILFIWLLNTMLMNLLTNPIYKFYLENCSFTVFVEQTNLLLWTLVQNFSKLIDQTYLSFIFF